MANYRDKFTKKELGQHSTATLRVHNNHSRGKGRMFDSHRTRIHRFRNRPLAKFFMTIAAIKKKSRASLSNLQAIPVVPSWRVCMHVFI